jgi:glycosyltransferase involved in cell wall biosynthesis
VKILVVTNWYPTERQPIYGIFVQDQVRALAAQHDVRVIAPTLLSPATLLRGTVPDRSASDVDSTGAMVLRPRVISPIPRYPALVAGVFAHAVCGAYDDTLTSWGPPDVIHAHVVLNAGYAAVELGRRLHVPVVITEHATSGSSWLRSPLRRGRAAQVYQSAAGVVAVSPALAARVERVAGRPVAVVGNVVDTDFFEPSAAWDRAKRTRFAFVGALIERKGADHLVRAASRLAAAGELDFEVRIGGAGPQQRQLERLVAEGRLEGRVTLLGGLDRPGVKALLSGGDVIVMPSHEETFGVAAAEAMAMGMPLVGFANGGFDFLASGTGSRLVENGDELALAAAMRSIPERLTAETRATTRASIVERFSPPAFRTAMAAVYASALD